MGGVRRLLRGIAAAVCCAAVPFVVVACSSAPASRAALPAGTASKGAAAPSGSAPRRTPSATDRPTTTASPRTGNGSSAADLRSYFPALPAGAQAEGDPEGSASTADEIAAVSDDADGTLRRLRSHGFRDAAVRTYLTAGGGTEVSVQLARFADAGQAADFYADATYQGTRLALSDGYPARAYDLASGTAESDDTLLATSYQGDVQITLTVTGGAHPSSTLLRSLLDEQHRRLATGR